MRKKEMIAMLLAGGQGRAADLEFLLLRSQNQRLHLAVNIGLSTFHSATV